MGLISCFQKNFSRQQMEHIQYGDPARYTQIMENRKQLRNWLILLVLGIIVLVGMGFGISALVKTNDSDSTDASKSSCDDNTIDSLFNCSMEGQKPECVPLVLVCDSKPDCSNGFDEMDCVRLSSDPMVLMDANKTANETAGFVWVKVKAASQPFTWSLYVSSAWSLRMSLQICEHIQNPQLKTMKVIPADEPELKYVTFYPNIHVSDSSILKNYTEELEASGKFLAITPHIAYVTCSI